MNQYFILAAAAAAFVAGALLAGTVSSSVYSRRLELVKAEARQQLEVQRKRTDDANVRANKAAADYERWKKQHQAKVITVVKEVQRELETHSDWAAVPVPDGVRDAITGAAAQLGAAEPDDGLRTVRQPASAF